MPSEADYLHAFQALQRGEGIPDIPVFAGIRRQTGGGLGDVLRGFWRFIFPMAKRAGTSFVTGLSSGLKSGTLREALASAAVPAATELIHGVVDEAASRIKKKITPSEQVDASGEQQPAQTGSGRRKRHHLASVYKVENKRGRKQSNPFVTYNF